MLKRVSPRRLGSAFVLIVLPVLAASLALADRVTLKNGTVLDGTAIKQGDGYWFKGADGQSRHISETEIDKIERGEHVESPSTPSRTATAPRGHSTLTLGE